MKRNRRQAASKLVGNASSGCSAGGGRAKKKEHPEGLEVTKKPESQQLK